MIKQQQTKHNYQPAIGYLNVLPSTGIVCPLSNDPFTVRFEKNDKNHRPESVQT